MKISTRRRRQPPGRYIDSLERLQQWQLGGDGDMVQAGGVMAEYLLIMERGGRATQQGLQYSLAA